MKTLTLPGAIGALCVGIVVLVAVVGLFWTPYDPLGIDLMHRIVHPSTKHLLGTDEFGRDELSRLMLGAATSVSLAMITVVMAVSAGTALGIIAGYARGWFDRVTMILTNALMSFPGLLLALAVLSIVGPGKLGIVIALSIAYLPSVIRLVRGTVMSIRAHDYVASSIVLGNSEAYTMIRHVLPNCVPPLIVIGTSMLGWSILAESALSFLGVGVPPPAPTWGNMLASARPFLAQGTFLSILPGTCIAVTLLGVNLLGDYLRDVLDPVTKGRRS